MTTDYIVVHWRYVTEFIAIDFNALPNINLDFTREWWPEEGPVGKLARFDVSGNVQVVARGKKSFDLTIEYKKKNHPEFAHRKDMGWGVSRLKLTPPFFDGEAIWTEGRQYKPRRWERISLPDDSDQEILAYVRSLDGDNQENKIRSNSNLTGSEKEQLIKARRGQGAFRLNVALIEKKCRVTGINAIEHLRASHIKPWTKCDNREKVDGNNGFLLAPHVDHLFDRGYITFNDDGTISVSESLDDGVMESWGIDPHKNVGPFNQEQRKYLSYHRSEVYEKK